MPAEKPEVTTILELIERMGNVERPRETDQIWQRIPRSKIDEHIGLINQFKNLPLAILNQNDLGSIAGWIRPFIEALEQMNERMTDQQRYENFIANLLNNIIAQGGKELLALLQKLSLWIFLVQEVTGYLRLNFSINLKLC